VNSAFDRGGSHLKASSYLLRGDMVLLGGVTGEVDGGGSDGQPAPGRLGEGRGQRKRGVAVGVGVDGCGMKGRALILSAVAWRCVEGARGKWRRWGRGRGQRKRGAGGGRQGRRLGDEGELVNFFPSRCPHDLILGQKL
jgi:hypothetical protein